MVRDQHMPISARWDGWLESLVEALEATAAGDSLGRCAPVSCAKARDAVLAHLSGPAANRQHASAHDPFGLPEAVAVYSPAICSRGRLRRSMPRNRASSCMM